MFHWMFNCREVTRLVSESLDRKLPLSQRIGVRIHLFMCKVCPEAKKQLLFIREAMRRLSAENMISESDGFLSPEARDRIKLALK
ncbi:zf-HC2 domain-containing protein, partial [Thermodesulfobacteriota bacterium]